MPVPEAEAVEWSRVSPRSLEIVKRIGFRLAMDLSFEEIAGFSNASVTSFATCGPQGATLAKAYVAGRVKELRQEIIESPDES